ncbi:hypothetical protein T09_2701, partial [Trichinella sp. T9]
MKLVPFATRVRMDVKAFPSRPSVPLLIANSQRRNSIFILFLIAMDYVIIRKFMLSRSRCHSQIAFPMVLMFFLVTQELYNYMYSICIVHNCEDESRILISIEYRNYSSSITYMNHGMFVFVDGVKYWYVASRWIKSQRT